jgi:hypothetical protein
MYPYRINPDAFTLGGSRLAALFHDNADDPVRPTDGRMSGLRGYKHQRVVSSAGARIASTPLVSPYYPSSLR